MASSKSIQCCLGLGLGLDLGLVLGLGFGLGLGCNGSGTHVLGRAETGETDNVGSLDIFSEEIS